jgi:uncharacterized protein YutE (UPF0331/DUF86 family)
MKLAGDVGLIYAKAAIVEQDFRVLDEIEAEGAEAFRKELRSYLAAQHALQQSIEAALDTANHLLAANRFRRPETLAGLFEILVAEGALDAELGARLGRMARFRNLLVHHYAALEPARVWTAVTTDRHDITAFFDTVLGLLEP